MCCVLFLPSVGQNTGSDCLRTVLAQFVPKPVLCGFFRERPEVPKSKLVEMRCFENKNKNTGMNPVAVQVRMAQSNADTRVQNHLVCSERSEPHGQSDPSLISVDNDMYDCAVLVEYYTFPSPAPFVQPFL